MQFQTYMKKHIIKYPTHFDLNSWWTFGSLLSIFFILQLITGIFLASYYIPQEQFALISIRFIIREVNGGWVAYRFHVVGSSAIFLILYLHILRGFYYNLYTWENRYSWWSGYSLFILTMATAFLGYILPWGQMSYWAATVIINMLSAIPGIGLWLTKFLWGGNTVNSYTLQRAFIGHIILPFLITAFIVLHISIMHNNTFLCNISESIPRYHTTSNRLINMTDLPYNDLYPDYFIKDLLMLILAAIIFLLFFVLNPELYVNYINWIPANASITPQHICPEWYFLPFYGILKLIPSKTFGILAMFLTILAPFLDAILYDPNR